MNYKSLTAFRHLNVGGGIINPLDNEFQKKRNVIYYTWDVILEINSQIIRWDYSPDELSYSFITIPANETGAKKKSLGGAMSLARNPSSSTRHHLYRCFFQMQLHNIMIQ